MILNTYNIKDRFCTGLLNIISAKKGSEKTVNVGFFFKKKKI